MLHVTLCSVYNSFIDLDPNMKYSEKVSLGPNLLIFFHSVEDLEIIDCWIWKEFQVIVNLHV